EVGNAGVLNGDGDARSLDGTLVDVVNVERDRNGLDELQRHAARLTGFERDVVIGRESAGRKAGDACAEEVVQLARGDHAQLRIGEPGERDETVRIRSS